MTLFKFGAFTSHSGVHLSDKINCDALTLEDWDTLAAWVACRINFRQVVSIPTGGDKFAAALDKHRKSNGCILIVDDVLTTGKSMEKMLRQYPYGEVRGAVVFARGPVPSWVIARFVEHHI